jgi:hypothetical protein
MPVQYYFDNLDPIGFQRLINSLLTSRYGEAIRLLPLRGSDGGRDAETPPHVDRLDFIIDRETSLAPHLFLKPGRYRFQVKHHRMADHSGTSVRSTVINEFEQELQANVLNQHEAQDVNYFFLVTNVSSSKDAITKIDEKRKELLAGKGSIHADVLWQEHVISWLDQVPVIWGAYPELFAGMQVPMLGRVAENNSKGFPRSVRVAVDAQSRREGIVRFKQINLETRLSKLFVDLDIDATEFYRNMPDSGYVYRRYRRGTSSIGLLGSEAQGAPKKILLEGGPGQGKSTVTQMLVQLYRSRLLDNEGEYGKLPQALSKARFPFRIELRLFAEWLAKTDGSVEQFLAEMYSRDAGGTSMTVENIHTVVEHQPVILMFDGLDEVGSDDLREKVISKLLECVGRFEDTLDTDLRVIITSRPPAIAASMSHLGDFTRLQILPLDDQKVDDFVERWSAVQCTESFERDQVLNSFKKRKSEEHVSALVKNPMQLSVLLHFIRLKGEAFPDRRAELYREYFKTVIDRDVEKSPRLRQNRDDIEALHEVIGFEIHSRAESDVAATSLSHDQLVEIVQQWLSAEGRKIELARELFKLGEERLGLIVALKGEGAGTRYGFEVQPVREYFAAAFINDKCEGNAHDLFELMVRRPFWREVALFLAGLRRANEKADLLSRARAIDDQIEHGWRYDGRAIVLQLLQEGVLTSPGHVHRDAISMLVEVLDPSISLAKNEPKDLADALPRLIQTCENQQPRITLEALLQKISETKDIYAAKNLWTVANKVVNRDRLAQYLLKYPQDKSEMFGRLALNWPAEAGNNFADILEKEGLFQQPPRREWAQSLFEAALQDSSVTTLKITPGYHEMLLEQFAFHLLSQYPHDNTLAPVLPRKPYAVWRLCQNIQWIALRLLSKEIKPIDLPEADYIGLENSLEECVKQLINSSTDAIQNLVNKRSIGKSLPKLIQTIETFIAADGLPSWIACRCALTLMQFGEGPQFHTQDGQRFYTARRTSTLINVDEWRVMRRNLTPLFRSAIPHDLDSAGRTMAGRILQTGLYRSCPSHVRIDGELHSIASLRFSDKQVNLRARLPWIERVPVPQYWIPEILDLDPTAAILGQVALGIVNEYGPEAQLGLLDMRKLNSAIKISNDPAIAAGGLFAFKQSKFWNIVGKTVLAKMLVADGDFLDIGNDLFSSSFYFAQHQPQRKVEMAQAIVDGKLKVSKATATAAARFLVENSAIKLPPLRTATTGWSPSIINN